MRSALPGSYEGGKPSLAPSKKERITLLPLLNAHRVRFSENGWIWLIFLLLCVLMLTLMLMLGTGYANTRQPNSPQPNTRQPRPPQLSALQPGTPQPSTSQHCIIKPNRFSNHATQHNTQNMVWIPAGTFMMGGNDYLAKQDEFPKHKVHMDGFWMDKTAITNAQFQAFVQATGYVTTAEKKPDWNELKKQLPPGTPKPADDQLVPASLVFVPPKHRVTRRLNHWWKWVKGASWRHPSGPHSSIERKGNYPVVHVSWFDANAYCQWAGKTLPTEAQYEWAARGGKKNQAYPWGNEAPEKGLPKANIWQGTFPYHSSKKDGFVGSVPVKSYPPNAYGLYDMAGNVWEWAKDNYSTRYYAEIDSPQGVTNPQGPAESYDPREPSVTKKAIRGGSFLCHKSYCAGYRVSARMRNTPDTSTIHIGFRCVINK